MKNLIVKIISLLSFGGRRNILFLQFSRNLLPIIFSALKGRNKIYFLEDRDMKYNWKDFTKKEYDRVKLTIDRLYIELSIYFTHNDIDELVLDKLNRDNLFHHVAIMVAKNSRTKIIYYEHGATGQILPVVNYQKFLFVNEYHAADSETQKFICDESRKTPVVSHSILMSTWNRPRPKKRSTFYDSDLILIAPQFNLGETFNELYPDTLKYKHNKVIFKKLEELAEKYNLKVIWKMLPSSEDDIDPMFDYITKYGNRVTIEIRNNFNKLIKKAGMFITDCYSTTLYDARYLGVPSFCYRYHLANPIREELKKEIGSSLCVYEDINRALVGMECFIISTLNKENRYDYVRNK